MPALMVPPVAKVIDGLMAAQLLQHLDTERNSLAAMLGTVRDVNQALKSLDDDALQHSIAAEARELAGNIDLQQQRRKLQSDLAVMLQLSPAEVTLKRLVTMTTGSARDSIEVAWRSLAEMAAEIDRLNRQNAAMIGQSLSIVRGVIERLTGVAGVGESYNANGAKAESHVGPLIQWGG